ncbi:KxDL motif-containing protein 1 [Halotydeus destructor]|nr:KxDL motif-containing protein 1 [Halotydeus destructor]
MDNSLVCGLTNLIDENDVSEIIVSQRQILARFEKANEMLVNCNALATFRFDATNRDLRAHTEKLLYLKKEIDMIFKRIRSLKTKLSQQYPIAFKEVVTSTSNNEDEDDD